MGQGWHVGIVLFFSVLFVGCGGRPTWEAFPVEVYADPALVSTVEGETDLQDAMSFWESRSGKKLFNYRGQWRGGTPYSGDVSSPQSFLANVVFFQNPWPFGPTVAGRTLTLTDHNTIEGALILVNPDMAYCSGACLGITNRTSQRNMLAHELGHFIGLDHVENDPNNVMYPLVLTVPSLSQATVDMDALRAVTDL